MSKYTNIIRKQLTVEGIGGCTRTGRRINIPQLIIALHRSILGSVNIKTAAIIVIGITSVVLDETVVRNTSVIRSNIGAIMPGESIPTVIGNVWGIISSSNQFYQDQYDHEEDRK